MSSAEHFSQAKQLLWTPYGVDETQIRRLLESMHTSHLNYGDLYFQRIQSESWVLEDGIVKNGSHQIGGGVGVRAVSGEKTGFSYSDDLQFAAIEKAAAAAKTIVRQGQSLTVPVLKQVEYEALYGPLNPLDTLTADQKVAMLKLVDQQARALDPHVAEVSVSLAGNWSGVLVASTDGPLAADVRPLVRFNVSVIMEKNGRRERGGCGGGGRCGYDMFDEATLNTYAREAVRMAQVNMDSVAAPAGTMPVVLGPGWPGVLLHEAVGHGLEGDFNRKGSSAFSGRVGHKVASDLCTVVDDGTLADRRGSLSVDDEGVASESTVLIENGILKGYMQDKFNAGLMGGKSTGNGRRESYAHLPMPRMTNTYMYPGQDYPEDIIRSVKKGIYAVNFGGGQVDITSGKFVFSANEAYLIEDGKVTRPVKGATLIGNGPEAMTRVSMVGNDLSLDRGVGVCGKEGQSVPVGVGQPTLKIDELTVGGTAS
ncbi:MAG: metalloprotease TldD [Ketobacteraceae bacterium]|nr:metalloprotease TldD [Ketobacteraceae bacterium]